MNSKNVFFILILAMLAIIFGCARNFSPVIEDTVRSNTTLEKEISTAANQFGIEIFRRIAEAKTDSNLFISPLSISFALGMAYDGAAGATADSMGQVLGYGTLTREEINQTYLSLMTFLSDLDSRVIFTVANSAWIREDFPVKDDYISTLETYFGAEIAKLDFSDPASVDVINNWVSTHTNGKIERIIDQIHPLTVLFLINALYFKGDWTYQFDPDKTVQAAFHLPNGSDRDAAFMAMKNEFAYYENELFQAVDLPYSKERYSMTILLPKSGKKVRDIIEELSQEHWQNWTGQMVKREITLQLPKFVIEYEIQLKDVLMAMGMGIAFSGQADFSGISDEQIFISKVKHKTYVKVNEEGTEAAAVTSVEMRLTSVGPMMIMDRPFIFFIRDHQAGNLLFMGITADPVYQE